MKLLRILATSLIVILLTGCQYHFLDLSAQLKQIPVHFPRNEYFLEPAWLSDKTIAFVETTTPNIFTNRTNTPQLGFYDVNAQIWTGLQASSDPNCRSLNFIYLQRLPNKQLGFLETCSTYAGGVSHTVQEIDTTTGKLQPLIERESIANPGKFTFSPDMSEAVQESTVGPGLSNQIYYVKNNSWIQTVPNFTRAMLPTWSPTDREIAFWGTENYPGGDPNNFQSFSQIQGLALYPWDLFLATPEGTNQKILISSVNDPYLIKWSPSGNKIGFAGAFEGVEGVWLVNPSTSTITRIWPTRSDFDWSPDGRKMVILDQTEDQSGNIVSQEINIVDLK